LSQDAGGFSLSPPTFKTCLSFFPSVLPPPVRTQALMIPEVHQSPTTTSRESGFISSPVTERLLCAQRVSQYASSSHPTRRIRTILSFHSMTKPSFSVQVFTKPPRSLGVSAFFLASSSTAWYSLKSPLRRTFLRPLAASQFVRRATLVRFFWVDIGPPQTSCTLPSIPTLPKFFWN